MRTLRPPLVVTFSVASMLPCCTEEPRAVISPDARPPTTAPTSGPTSSPPAPPPPRVEERGPRDEPYAFEADETILNPKIRNRRVFWDGFESCYTLGPEDQRSTGIQFARQPVPCPEEAATLLAGCAGSLLRGRDGACSCDPIEGNPPRPPTPVACPTP